MRHTSYTGRVFNIAATTKVVSISHDNTKTIPYRLRYSPMISQVCFPAICVELSYSEPAFSSVAAIVYLLSFASDMAEFGRSLFAVRSTRECIDVIGVELLAVL